VFLFQESVRQPQNDLGVTTIEPALTPSALAAAKDALEMIGRLYVSSSDGLLGADDVRSISADAEEQRRLFIGKHDRIFAKGPTHILGRIIESPTWSKLAESLAKVKVGDTAEKKEE
jgi:hypothetical protein